VNVVLPIGISFFTFQAVSYLADLGTGRLERPLSLLDTGLYLSFFPQLVAGPIVRATEMAGQISHRPDPRFIPAGEAFWLIAQGLFKKVVISSYLAANLVDPVFDVPGEHSQLDVLLAAYGFAVQIYADFSGYTDIAIGCALLLGFRFPRNFDAPYRALSVTDFCRRWHMTLSRWLRDYLYRPLGGSRRGRLLTYRNLAVTMLLGGLWHGAGWTFVVWGAIHGAMLIAERAAGEVWRPLGLPHRLVTTMRWPEGVEERNEERADHDHRERQAQVHLHEPHPEFVALSGRADVRDGAGLGRHHGEPDGQPGESAVGEEVAFHAHVLAALIERERHNPNEVQGEDAPVDASHGPVWSRAIVMYWRAATRRTAYTATVQ
jgi:hypothetical protein